MTVQVRVPTVSAPVQPSPWRGKLQDLGKGWGLLTGEWKQRDALRSECAQSCLRQFNAVSAEFDVCNFNCQAQYEDGLVNMGQKMVALLGVAGAAGLVGIYLATRKKR
jgi:hypothetical protein